MAEKMNLNGMDYKQQKDPLKKSRSCTNVKSLAIFFSIFTTWLGLLLNVSFNYPQSEFAPLNENETITTIWTYTMVPTMYLLMQPFIYLRGEDIPSTYLVAYTFFGTALILVILFGYRWIHKVGTYIVIIIAFIYLLDRSYFQSKIAYHKTHDKYITKSNITKSFDKKQLTVSAIMYIIYNNIIPLMAIFCKIISSLVLIIIIAICIIQAKIKEISEILYKAFRALFAVPSLIIFGFVILFLQVVILFTILIGVANNYSGEPVHEAKYTIIKILMLMSTLYISSFLYYFAKMVIYEVIACWHWAPKNKTSGITIFRCIYTVLRYHLGSIAFGATVILPFFLAIYVAFKTKYYGTRKSCGTLINFFCKVFLVFNVTNYTLVQTAANGQSFFPAMKRTFYLIVKNCHLSLAVIYILHYFLQFLLLLTIALGYMSAYLLFEAHGRSDHPTVVIFKSARNEDYGQYLLSIFSFLMTPAILTAEASVRAALICRLEDKEESDKNGVKLFSINNRVL